MQLSEFSYMIFETSIRNPFLQTTKINSVDI